MDAISYHCPSCSADLKFNPTTGSFVCTYCESVFTRYDLEDQNQLGDAPAQGESTHGQTPQGETPQVMEYHCANCGAQVITGATTLATECYYCHSAVILKSRLDDGTLPKRIVPFRLDKAAAQETFRKWAQRKNFIPEDGMEPFSMTYLAGFQAEEKDLDASESGTPELTKLMSDYAEAKVRDTLPRSGRNVRTSFDFAPQAVHWEYSLMPVWLLSRCYKGEYYYFAMNAQTGKVCGKLPMDEAALLRYAKRLGLTIGTVLFLLGFVFLGGM